MDDNLSISKESVYYGDLAIICLLLVVTSPVSLSVIYWLYDQFVSII